MESKHIFLSKIFWANVLGLVAIVATAEGVDLGLSSDVQAEIVAGILAVVNVILRMVTRQPVHIRT